MKEDISKLPKWAQSELIALRSNMKYLQKQINEIETHSGDMHWRSLIDFNTKHGIPNDAEVVVKIPGGELHISIIDDYLKISSIYTSLIVQPQASNVIRLKLEDAW